MRRKDREIKGPADILAIIYENILREGALPSPDQI